jgi:hypothetical protein
MALDCLMGKEKVQRKDGLTANEMVIDLDPWWACLMESLKGQRKAGLMEFQLALC